MKAINYCKNNSLNALLNDNSEALRRHLFFVLTVDSLGGMDLKLVEAEVVAPFL